MLHVWYIYLHDWVIYVGQMLVNIPAPRSIWACEPLKKQTTICCCGRSSTEPRFGHAWPTGNTAATVKSGNSCGKAQLGTYETSKCAETRRKERRKEKQSCYHDYNSEFAWVRHQEQIVKTCVNAHPNCNTCVFFAENACAFANENK